MEDGAIARGALQIAVSSAQLSFHVAPIFRLLLKIAVF